MFIINIVTEIQVNLLMIFLLSIILISYYFNIKSPNIIDRLCFLLQSTLLVVLIIEVICILYSRDYLLNNIALNKFINVISFSLTPIPFFIFWVFITIWIHPNTEFNKQKILIILLPIILNFIVSVFSWNYSLIFDISSTNTYLRGPLFIITPLTSGFYSLLSLNFLWKHIKTIKPEEFIAFNIIIILPLLFGFIQLQYIFLITTWSGCAISAIILHIFIVNNKAGNFTLAALNNRANYYTYIDTLKRKNNIKVSIIKINLFTLDYINENFGHSAGAEAIEKFYKFLTNIFGETNKIAWLGGDKFIVVLEDDNETIITYFLHNLIEKVNLYNIHSNKKFNIEFSYSIRILNRDATSLYNLLNFADNKKNVSY